MEQEEWDEIVGHLITAKAELQQAHTMMDGIDGWAREAALNSVLSGIDALFFAEWTHYARRGLVLPPGVAEEIGEIKALPGFALSGTGLA